MTNCLTTPLMCPLRNRYPSRSSAFEKIESSTVSVVCRPSVFLAQPLHILVHKIFNMPRKSFQVWALEHLLSTYHHASRLFILDNTKLPMVILMMMSSMRIMMCLFLWQVCMVVFMKSNIIAVLEPGQGGKGV